MIGRRNFLKAIGLGAATAPAAAKTMTDLTPNGLGLSKFAYADFAGPAVTESSSPPASEASSSGTSWMVEELRSLVDDTLSRERYRETQVAALDAGLASMASISLANKIRMQRKINFDRYTEERSLWLRRKLGKIG